jgi:two-component system sensor histidine kinase SenX3
VAVIVALVAGLLLGVVTVIAVRKLGRSDTETELPASGAGSGSRQLMPADTVLQLLPTAAVLIDPDDNVRLANVAAVTMGIVRGRTLAVPELAQLVRVARRSGKTQNTELVLDSGGFPRRMLAVGARAQPVDDGDVALVVDDLTETKRVESVRRDFVANVGHEIKTPVGALTLLAEAALGARDDPDAVHHFLTRMQHEASRLSRLVQELLDLSRIQGGESPPDATDVRVDAVVDEAVDRSRLVAEARRIEIERGGDSGLVVVGSESQLVTAVSNLLDNAVAYSPDRTQVAVGVHRRHDAVEIAVRDQGIGIEDSDQERIFERFYRVDPARSRATGGTGLGLAIVKHIVSNHGGEITVWSQPGAGSTFTIRLPLAAVGPSAAAPQPQEASSL